MPEEVTLATATVPTTEPEGSDQAPPDPDQALDTTEEASDETLQSVAERMFGTEGGRESEPSGRPDDGSEEVGSSAPDSQDGKKDGTEATGAAEDFTKGKAREILGHLKAFRPGEDGKNAKLDVLSDTELVSRASEQARQALKRDQWDDETIDELPVDLLLAKGAQATQKQVEIDRAINERAQLRQMLEEIEAERSQGAGKQDEPETVTVGDHPTGVPQRGPDGRFVPAAETQTGQERPPAASADTTKALKDIIDKIEDDAEVLDAATVKPVLTEALQAIATTTRNELQAEYQSFLESQLQEQRQQFDAALEGVYSQLDQIVFNSVAGRLAADLPNLSDPTKAREVFRKVQQLGEAEQSYRDDDGNLNWDEVVHDAYHVLYSRDLGKQHQEALVRRYRNQTKGQPKGRTEGSGGTPGAAMTPSEQMASAWQRLAKGENPDEVAESIQRRSA